MRQFQFATEGSPSFDTSRKVGLVVMLPGYVLTT